MAFKATVQIEGLKELEQALLELKATTARSVMRKALMAGAKPIVEHAKRLAPVKTGKLRDSIKVWAKSGNRVGMAEFHQTLKSGGTKDEAVAALRSARREARRFGPTVPTLQLIVAPDNRPNAHLQEFGSVRHRPHPYMRPAWQAERDPAFARIKEELTAEFRRRAEKAQRAALRAERRAARAAKLAAAGN